MSLTRFLSIQSPTKSFFSSFRSQRFQQRLVYHLVALLLAAALENIPPPNSQFLKKILFLE